MAISCSQSMSITTDNLKYLITSYSQSNTEESVFLQLNAERLRTDAKLSKKLISFFADQQIEVETELGGFMFSIGLESRDRLLVLMKQQEIFSVTNRRLAEENNSSVEHKFNQEDQDGSFSLSSDDEQIEAGSCPDFFGETQLSGHGNRSKAFRNR